MCMAYHVVRIKTIALIDLLGLILFNVCCYIGCVALIYCAYVAAVIFALIMKISTIMILNMSVMMSMNFYDPGYTYDYKNDD